MWKFKLLSLFVIIICIQQSSRNVFATEIRVAVANNFANTIKQIARNFEKQTAHKVWLIFGSTGKHYAQIKNGAPFDIYFAADIKRPKLLDEEGIVQKDSRFTYALGKLVLWSPSGINIDSAGKVLEQQNIRHLAMANPKLAPYGKAAQEVLETLGLWDVIRNKIVLGENIGQTFQFVKSGNAELGFVAYSQLIKHGQVIDGTFWNIPTNLYSPIEQQVVLLNSNQTALDFISYFKSNESQKTIRQFGYSTP